MERLERGTRNLEKLLAISKASDRGKLTLWNPRADQKHFITVHATDAKALTVVYEALSADNKEKFRLNLATVAGFNQMHSFAWSRVSFRQV
jgi:hypothetical protein